MAVKRKVPHYLQVAIKMRPTGTPLTSRPVPSANDGSGEPMGLDDQEHDLMQDVQDVIQALSEAAPGDPRVAQVERLIREILQSAGHGEGGMSGGGSGRQPAGAGPTASV